MLGPTHRIRRRFALVGAPLFLVALWLAAGAALAAPGDLDTSFGGGDGKALVDFGGADGASAIALQPDGKLVLAGRSAGALTTDVAVARLLPQGSLDPSFRGPALQSVPGGGDGKALVSFSTFDFGFDVAVQPDGKIVVAGNGVSGPASTQDFAVARLLSGGSPDGSFAGDGTLLYDFGAFSGESANSVALQPDGKIVVAGQSSFLGGLLDLAAMRLLTNGTPDPMYGNGAYSLANVGGHDIAEAVALRPDGKIVLAGFSNSASTGTDFAVARLLSSGQVDATFGDSGIGGYYALIDFGGGGTEYAAAVALQGDGKIVVAGQRLPTSTTGYDFAVARLQQDGSLDSSFGNAGKVLVDLGGSNQAYAVALQPDGKILVAGTRGSDFAVVRLQPNGLLDSTFGNGGRALADIGGDDNAYAMALQPDGKIILAGATGATAAAGDFAIARLQGDVGGGGGGERGGPPVPPRCAGRSATIVGTKAADRLKGTRRRDVIVSLGGSDRIRGRGGKDLVCTGPGNDYVGGGGGNDRLFGQRGKDRLRGERGNDKLLGGRGRDRLFGGPGRDRLLGGPGRDRLLGGPGRDRQRQ